MGRASRATRVRRRLDAERRQANAAMATGPVLQAVSGSFFDDGCARLASRDAHQQRARLTNAGWTNVDRNRDGIGTWDHATGFRIVHSVAREQDGHAWAHVSVSHASRTLPSWAAVRDAGWLLYPGRFGIVVVAPPSSHVNIAEVMHVWFCLTGPSCPDFSRGLGTI